MKLKISWQDAASAALVVCAVVVSAIVVRREFLPPPQDAPRPVFGWEPLARRTPDVGPASAAVRVVLFSDYECPYCRQAEPAVLDLLERWDGRLRHVWRHLPLTDVHPNAALAAEAAEAAHAQGRFWEMHDLLLTRDQPPDARALVAYARELGLDIDRFREDLLTGRHAGRVARDVESFVKLTGADEIMAVTNVDNAEARLRSYELLAEAMGIEA